VTSAALLAGLALYPVGVPHYWGLAEIETSPGLAVCTVEQVVKLGPVPPQVSRSHRPQHYYEAHLLVHRVFFPTAERPFDSGDRITVRYINDEPCTGGCGGGGGFEGPPNFLELLKGQIAIFPLKPDKRWWALRGIAGRNTVPPGYLADPAFGDPPRTGRQFILRELTNALTHGSAPERSRAASFLLTPSIGIPPELPRFIRVALSTRDDEWLETGCAFLGSLGYPGNIPELVYGETSPPFQTIRQLITWILWKGDRRDYPNRLIRRLLRNTPYYAWGAANVLVDFKDSTVLIDELNASLRRGSSGAITVASSIVKSGQRAVLPNALNLAQKQVAEPASVLVQELRTAAQMLIAYGDDRQFETLVAALRRLKQQDENHYRDLWWGAASAQNRRQLRLAPILIDDRRQVFGALRYCDHAAWSVQELSGAKFGTGRMEMMPLPDRDRFVARAAAWLNSHP
jgi:hypothetical protein